MKIISFKGTAGSQKIGYFSLMKYFGFIDVNLSVRKDNSLCTDCDIITSNPKNLKENRPKSLGLIYGIDREKLNGYSNLDWDIEII